MPESGAGVATGSADDARVAQREVDGRPAHVPARARVRVHVDDGRDAVNRLGDPDDDVRTRIETEPAVPHVERPPVEAAFPVAVAVRVRRADQLPAVEAEREDVP